MMEKSYILENGVLELYVLGELNLSEQSQLEEALLRHPELQKKLNEIESSFEHLAADNGIDVPGSVKEELFSKIDRSKVKTIPKDATESKTSFIWMVASVAVLFFISTIYLFSELNSLKEEVQIVTKENKNKDKQLKQLNAALDETNKWYETINNPETEKYVMKGNSLMPEATVIGYVNDKEKSVVINTKNLPELDASHDYQMWADVEGVMIDMGIIDKRKEMLAMTYINHAESLNITIEEAGGSDHPNVSKLVTNIYLK